MSNVPAMKPPRAIFNQAQRFHLAMNILKGALIREPPPVSHLMFPTMVQAALASELYLKCLIAIYGAPNPLKHDLKFLYMQLPVSTRSSINRDWKEQFSREARLNAKRGGLKIDLNTVLESQSDWFLRLRYWHESNNVLYSHNHYGKIISIVHFPPILESYIKKTHPDWK